MRSIRAALGLAAVALVLSGCGGGSGSSSSSSVSTAPIGSSTGSGTGSGSGSGTGTGTSAPGSGSATLVWSAPTANTNGTALTNLAGYDIYYGTSPTSMTSEIQVTNPGTLSYVITNLSAGTWYFTITAYTSEGVQSAQSNVGSKTII